jgi:hypothetical protein
MMTPISRTPDTYPHHPPSEWWLPALNVKETLLERTWKHAAYYGIGTMYTERSLAERDSTSELRHPSYLMFLFHYALVSRTDTGGILH